MIVNERLEFKRGIEPKEALKVGMHVPGSLFRYKDNYVHRKEFPSIFIFIESDKEYNYYYYLGRFVNSKESITGSRFYFGNSPDSDSRWNLQSKKDDHMTLLESKERDLMKDILSDPDNSDILTSIQRNAKVTILESANFERGLSKGQIKDQLIGFRPGLLVKRSFPQRKIKEIFMFVQTRNDGHEYYELLFMGHIYMGFPDYYSLKNVSMKTVFLEKNEIEFLSEIDRENIQKELIDPQNKKYIDFAKKITGLTPFVS